LRVVAVQNSLTALADDVDAVTRALNHQAPPVVLVGHDYGGTVITQAGRQQTVAALVYIAACAPDIGESTANGQADRCARAVTSSFTIDAGGFSLPCAERSIGVSGA
jgi:pimeloyl-ACP methyl ester carboxylesterase